MSEFFYRSGPNEYGPLTSTELKKLAGVGRLVAGDDVRKGRSGKWVSAASVQGLFSPLVRHEELAINEMDIVTDVQSAAPLEFDAAEQAGRDTAVDSQAESGEPAATRAPNSAPMSDRRLGDRWEVLLVHWATAVAGMCYFASLVGMLLGIFHLFGDQSQLHHVFIGICFLFALVGLASGCGINLLVAICLRQRAH